MPTSPDRLIPALLALLAHALGLALAVRAVLHGRTSQGTIAWIFALVVFPYLAVPLYLIAGFRRFEGYADARRSGDAALAPLGRELIERARAAGCLAQSPDPDLAALCGLARQPFVSGNRCELLIGGRETFDSILAGIAAAREYVLVEFYIIKDDELGGRLQAVLLERARAGVRVYLCYDEIGCLELPQSWLDPLEEAGVQVRPFQTTRGLLHRLRLIFRNHRKLVVVDGRTAWVGGANVGDEYLRWRDTHLRVDGPAAQAVQLCFVEDWRWAAGEAPEVSWRAVESQGPSCVLTLPTGPADPLETASLFFVQAIHMARSRLWISSPYFVPDSAVVAALQLAALRGVDVRVLIPGRSDLPLAQWAAYSYIPEIAGHGVRLLAYEGPFLHQKAMLIDERLAAVGTANLDNRSLRINFEITMLSTDATLIGEVDRMLREDFARARELTASAWDARPWWHHLAARGARLWAPVL